MSRLRGVTLWLALLALAGCTIEDHTPTGSRRDEAAIQSLAVQYARSFTAFDWSAARGLFWADAMYSGPLVPIRLEGHQAVPIGAALDQIARRVAGIDSGRFEIRILRSDLRQDGDLGALWLTTRRRLPEQGAVAEGDWSEHLVVRRIGGEWKILSLAAVPITRRSSRAR